MYPTMNVKHAGILIRPLNLIIPEDSDKSMLNGFVDMTAANADTTNWQYTA